MQHHPVSDPFVWRPAVLPQASSGPLAGLRLAVKDLFHIEGVVTTAGNFDWAASHAVPDETSPVVRQLVAAGAVLVGKTITDELAYSLNGQNIHFGTPINGRTPDRLPGGSSSGSAVAVATGMADIGLGTDTGGSIRVPASYNGLYGLRPSHGYISTEQMVGLAPSFDTVGWMTRDLKTLNRVAASLLPESPEAVTQWRWADDLLMGCSQIDLAEQWRRTHLSQATPVGTRLPQSLLAAASAAFRVLQGREIWAMHGAWMTDVQPRLAPDIAERFAWCATLTAEEEALARSTQRQIQDQVLPLVAHSALVIPTTPGPAPLLASSAAELTAYRNRLLGLTALAGLCGLPQLHLPLFVQDGATVGLSLLGSRGHDRALIDAAIALTADTNHRQPSLNGAPA